MATTLQKRVAKAVAQLEADVDAGVVTLNAYGKVDAFVPELVEDGGQALRDRASAPRLTAEVRRNVAEIARRKLNRELAAG